MRAVFFDENGNKPCSKCKRLLTKDSFNISNRHKSGYTSSCKECMKRFRESSSDKISEYKRQYYVKNRDVLIKKQKELRLKNPEELKLADRQKYLKSRDKVLARVSTYAKNNPEVNRAAAKRYRDSTPEKQAEKAARYRARKQRAVPIWANNEFEQLFISEIYSLAKLRSKLLGVSFNVDHIVPLKSDLVCGLHCKDNLQILLGKDNFAKRNHHWPDMPE